MMALQKQFDLQSREARSLSARDLEIKSLSATRFPRRGYLECGRLQKHQNSRTTPCNRSTGSSLSPLQKMRSFLSLLPLSGLLIPVQSLYFFIDGTTPKCFYEELPKDTIVVGHYSAEEFNADHNGYVKSEWLNIFISVDVRPHSHNCHPPFGNQMLTLSHRKSSTTTTASSPKEVPQQGASLSQPPTPATTRSASRPRTRPATLGGSMGKLSEASS
jgi:hypothetical protein